MIGDGEQLAQKQNTGSHSGQGTQCFIIQPANESINNWQKGWIRTLAESLQLPGFQSWTLTATVHSCWDDWASAATGIWTIYTKATGACTLTHLPCTLTHRQLQWLVVFTPPTATGDLYFNTLTATGTYSIYTTQSYRDLYFNTLTTTGTCNIYTTHKYRDL